MIKKKEQQNFKINYKKGFLFKIQFSELKISCFL